MNLVEILEFKDIISFLTTAAIAILAGDILQHFLTKRSFDRLRRAPFILASLAVILGKAQVLPDLTSIVNDNSWMFWAASAWSLFFDGDDSSWNRRGEPMADF